MASNPVFDLVASDEFLRHEAEKNNPKPISKYVDGVNIMLGVAEDILQIPDELKFDSRVKTETGNPRCSSSRPRNKNFAIKIKEYIHQIKPDDQQRFVEQILDFKTVYDGKTVQFIDYLSSGGKVLLIEALDEQRAIDDSADSSASAPSPAVPASAAHSSACSCEGGAK